MSLVDASAWVEHLRDTGSPTCLRVAELLRADPATCDIVRMELLTRVRDERRRDIRMLIARAAFIPLQPGDLDRAAALYGQSRSRGEIVRVLLGCLTAALA